MHGGVTQQPAGVGAQAGGQIDGQHRRRARVEVTQRGGQRAGRGTCGAQAQQRVDGQGRGLGTAVRYQASRDGHAGLLRLLQCVGGVGRPPAVVAPQRHLHPPAQCMQVPRSHQAVAAVVAGAAGHPHAACAWRDGHRQPGHGQAGAGHQRMRCSGGQRRLLDGPAGRTAVQRPAALRGQHGLRAWGVVGWGHRCAVAGRGSPHWKCACIVLYYPRAGAEGAPIETAGEPS
jgi:hypothetical protein